MRSMRALLHATVAGISLAGLPLPGNPTAGDPAEPAEVWLREGADLSVSATPDGEHIVFGLVARAWALDPADGFATQLSEDDELARGPALSPDGKLLAYETIRDGYHQIIVRNADGSMPRQVTFGRFNHRSPMWSRSSPARPFAGNRLIMSSDRGGRYGVWEIDVDTLDLQQLTFASHDEHEPAWNDDGTRIAYVTETPGGTALYVAAPGGQPELLLEEKARIRAPAWRPGGGLLTYVRQAHGKSQLRMLLLSDPAITKPITHGENVFPYPARWLGRSRFLYTADGQIRRRLFGEREAETIAFNARIEVASHDWTARPLVIAPDGNRPVTGSNGHSVAGDGRHILATLGDLWVVRADGTLLRQLTNDPYVDAQPAWSPDGGTVAFVSDRGGSLQVWLHDLESAAARPLTREHGVALEPRWAADGASIEYLAAAHPAAADAIRKRIDVESGRVEVIDTAGGDAAAYGPPGQDSGAAIPLTWRPLAGGGRKIVRAGRVFDGMGSAYATEQEIVIDGDRITAIRPWDPTTESDDDVDIIDAADQTVLPGLIDMSVRQARIGDERLGRKYLAYGVTTIREAITNPAEAAERRESWDSGRRIGPRLLTTSTPCSDAPGGFIVRPVLQPAVAQRDFRMRINDAIERGSVSVGVCQSLNISARVDLIATVHGRGLPAMTATTFPDVLLGANETRPPAPASAGYDDFALVTGTLGTTVTSNLAALGLPLLVSRGELLTGWQYRELFTRAEQEWYARAWDLADEDLMERKLEAGVVGRGLVDALARGARVVVGSDAPTVPPGLSLHAELRLLADAGLQPFQVLWMATRDPGRALGAGDRLGVIRPGAIADLIIVDGDPLVDIRDAARISMTIRGGHPYPRRELSSPGNRPASVGNLYN